MSDEYKVGSSGSLLTDQWSQIVRTDKNLAKKSSFRSFLRSKLLNQINTYFFFWVQQNELNRVERNFFGSDRIGSDGVSFLLFRTFFFFFFWDASKTRLLIIRKIICSTCCVFISSSDCFLVFFLYWCILIHESEMLLLSWSSWGGVAPG